MHRKRSLIDNDISIGEYTPYGFTLLRVTFLPLFFKQTLRWQIVELAKSNLTSNLLTDYSF